MRRVLVIAVVALLGACHREPPPDPPDPCPALRARYESALAQGSCETDEECVGAPTIPGHGAHTDDESRIGPRDEPPCTPATHRDSLAAVDAAAHAFAAAGCGAVVPVSSHCGNFGHGMHLTCVEHRCEVAY